MPPLGGKPAAPPACTLGEVSQPPYRMAFLSLWHGTLSRAHTCCRAPSHQGVRFHCPSFPSSSPSLTQGNALRFLLEEEPRTYRHALLCGQRGAGKSLLLHRLMGAIAARSRAALPAPLRALCQQMRRTSPVPPPPQTPVATGTVSAAAAPAGLLPSVSALEGSERPPPPVGMLPATAPPTPPPLSTILRAAGDVKGIRAASVAPPPLASPPLAWVGWYAQVGGCPGGGAVTLYAIDW